MDRIPTPKLYHATYLYYLPDILAHGLGGVAHRNWPDSSGVVCMALDPNDAEAYAETAIDEELVHYYIWNSGIVVLEINVEGLEADMSPDPNLQIDEMEEFPAWIYPGVILPHRIKVHGINFDY